MPDGVELQGVELLAQREVHSGHTGRSLPNFVCVVTYEDLQPFSDPVPVSSPTVVCKDFAVMMDMYRMHQHSSVRLDITKLQVHPWLRPINNDHLLKLKCSMVGCAVFHNSFVVTCQRGGFEHGFGVVMVLHQTSPLCIGMAKDASDIKLVVVDGNHRVLALQELYMSTEDDVKEQYRYISGVILHPATPTAVVKYLSSCK